MQLVAHEVDKICDVLLGLLDLLGDLLGLFVDFAVNFLRTQLLDKEFVVLLQLGLQLLLLRDAVTIAVQPLLDLQSPCWVLVRDHLDRQSQHILR